jgi:hypothetical protein
MLCRIKLLGNTLRKEIQWKEDRNIVVESSRIELATNFKSISKSSTNFK